MTARKATFRLSEGTLLALDDAVARGGAPSKNAFVEQAMLRAIRDFGRQERRRRWDEAMRDPLFVRDVEEIEAAFASADAETARQIV